MNLPLRHRNWTSLALLLAIAGVPIVSLSGTAEPGAERVVELRIVGRKAQGGTRTLKASKGERVVIAVRADEALTIHVHGYDLQQHIVPGVVARLVVVASAVGRFPITAHLHAGDSAHRREPTLLYLEVHPE